MVAMAHTHLPSAWSPGPGTRGPSPAPPSRGCTGVSAAQGEALGREGGSEWPGLAAHLLLPRCPTLRLLSAPLGQAGLPLRNSWVWGSRSQRPGGLGELSSHLSVAWKAFFKTCVGRVGLQGREGAAPPRLPTVLLPLLWA